MEQTLGVFALSGPGLPCTTTFTGSPWSAKSTPSSLSWHIRSFPQAPSDSSSHSSCSSPGIPSAQPASGHLLFFSRPGVSFLPLESHSAFTAISTEPSPVPLGSLQLFEPLKQPSHSRSQWPATVHSLFKAHISSPLLQEHFPDYPQPGSMVSSGSHGLCVPL